MSKYLSGVAALALLAAATFALPASAAERQAGAAAPQSTEFSSQRHYRHGRAYSRHWRGGPRYYAQRRYYGGPAYGYYDNPYPYYGYYRPAPFVSFGIGPFGFVF